MAVSLWELAQSIGSLAEPGTTQDAEQALGQAVEAARVLLDTDTAGLLLADADGELSWAVSADARAKTAAEAQQRLALGPCVAAYQEARPIIVVDVTTDGRWEQLRQALVGSGVRACLNVPVTLAGGPVGVLKLYSATPRSWDDSQIATAQTYAGVLSLLLGSALTAANASQLADQLQHALNARVQIEQAKGVLMGRHHLDQRAAWERLRRSARSSQRPVGAVAAEVLAEVTPEGDWAASDEEVVTGEG